MNTKLIVGCIGGTTALGGAAGGCYYLLNKETANTPNQQEQLTREKSTKANTKQTIKEALKGDDFEALDTTEGADKDTWKKLISKYNEEGNTPKIVVDGITKEATDDDNAANIKRLQTACKTLLDKKDNIEDNDKIIAKNWCNKHSTLIK